MSWSRDRPGSTPNHATTRFSDEATVDDFISFSNEVTHLTWGDLDLPRLPGEPAGYDVYHAPLSPESERLARSTRSRSKRPRYAFNKPEAPKSLRSPSKPAIQASDRSDISTLSDRATLVYAPSASSLQSLEPTRHGNFPQPGWLLNQPNDDICWSPWADSTSVSSDTESTSSSVADGSIRTPTVDLSNIGALFSEDVAPYPVLEDFDFTTDSLSDGTTFLGQDFNVFGSSGDAYSTSLLSPTSIDHPNSDDEETVRQVSTTTSETQSILTGHASAGSLPKCSLCDTSFKTPYELSRHHNTIHQRAVSYRCSAPICKKRDKLWTRVDNFRKHIRTHHSEEDAKDLLRRSEIRNNRPFGNSIIEYQPMAAPKPNTGDGSARKGPRQTPAGVMMTFDTKLGKPQPFN